MEKKMDIQMGRKKKVKRVCVWVTPKQISVVKWEMLEPC